MRPNRNPFKLPTAIAGAFTAAVLLAGLAAPAHAEVPAGAVKNIVLVHGAFADGSGWKAVYDILSRDGYNVNMVQHPETSLEDDVAATKRVLARQDGPSVLVGHSYGGHVITAAGTDPRVAGLVYIAAHAPDAGESPVSNRTKMPGATKGIGATPDGFLFLDPKVFHADFAADLPAAQAEFMARSQVPAAVKAMTTPITDPAWRVKRSWYMVAKDDRIINPDLERMYAARAHSVTVEVPGSHSVYVSHPAEVAALIEEAARALGKPAS